MEEGVFFRQESNNSLDGNERLPIQISQDITVIPKILSYIFEDNVQKKLSGQ